VGSVRRGRGEDRTLGVVQLHNEIVYSDPVPAGICENVYPVTLPVPNAVPCRSKVKTDIKESWAHNAHCQPSPVLGVLGTWILRFPAFP